MARFALQLEVIHSLSSMCHLDSYASGESSRRAQYAAAFASPEAKAWEASLSPADRARAASLGLLSPCFDPAPGGCDIDSLPRALEPRLETGIPGEPDPPARPDLCDVDELSPHHRRLLEAFFQQWGSPELLWACFRFVMGRGSCIEHARALGLSKQAFYYHAKRLASVLGLPALGNRASERARESYRLRNRRKAPDPPDKDSP